MVKSNKSAFELKLRSYYKIVDYGGKAYGKVGGAWAIYDFSHKPKSGKDIDHLIYVTKTAKEARAIIDKWNAVPKRRKKK